MGWGSGAAVSYGVGRRCGLDPLLLWLWCRPASIPLIRPLAWELPYAVGIALKKKSEKEKQKKKYIYTYTHTEVVSPILFPFKLLV